LLDFYQQVALCCCSAFRVRHDTIGTFIFASDRREDMLKYHLSIQRLITPPPIGERNIVITVSCLSVCLFVCPRAYLRKYRSVPIFVRVTYGCGSVLLWRRCDTLWTSGFTDDVILADKPRQVNVAAQLMEAQPTCNLGLGYNKRRVGIPVAVQWTHGPTFRVPQSGPTRPQWACWIFMTHRGRSMLSMTAFL